MGGTRCSAAVALGAAAECVALLLERLLRMPHPEGDARAQHQAARVGAFELLLAEDEHVAEHAQLRIFLMYHRVRHIGEPAFLGQALRYQKAPAQRGCQHGSQLLLVDGNQAALVRLVHLEDHVLGKLALHILPLLGRVDAAMRAAGVVPCRGGSFLLGKLDLFGLRLALLRGVRQPASALTRGLGLRLGDHASRPRHPCRRGRGLACMACRSGRRLV